MGHITPKQLLGHLSEDPWYQAQALPALWYLVGKDERYQIQILLKAGHNQSQIALLINRNKSTISRELLRNRGLRGYRPKQASKFALMRISNKQ